jgi:hypothetical protein
MSWVYCHRMRKPVKMRSVLLAGLASAALGVSVLTPPAVAQQRFAPPPSAQQLVAASNAMLQPNEVSGPLLAGTTSSDRLFSTGFNNPPGGQDPLPVCVSGRSNTTVSIPDAMATGFFTSDGRVSQVAYTYPGTTAANRAWKRLSANIASQCNGSFTEGGTRVTATAQRIPGLPQGQRGWGVRSTGNLNAYSTVHLVGDSIQMVSFLADRPAALTRARAPMNQLAATLAGRWVNRATLPLTQNPVITRAESSMVQTSDIPSGLRVAKPAQGAWSGLSASLPGNALDIFCARRTTLPTPPQSFFSILGASGDVFGLPSGGSVTQQLQVFSSPQDAQQAWQQATRAVQGCSQNPTGPIPTKEDFTRSTNGTANATVDGVQGVSLRQLQTYPSNNRSVNSYSVYLLAGEAVQVVTYSVTVRGSRQAPINQSAVDTLAQQLADRWVQAGR